MYACHSVFNDGSEVTSSLNVIWEKTLPNILYSKACYVLKLKSEIFNLKLHRQYS